LPSATKWAAMALSAQSVAYAAALAARSVALAASKASVSVAGTIDFISLAQRAIAL